MKITSNIPVEPVYNLELTKTELMTLIVGYGNSSPKQREDSAHLDNVKILSHEPAHEMYNQLCDALGLLSE